MTATPGQCKKWNLNHGQISEVLLHERIESCAVLSNIIDDIVGDNAERGDDNAATSSIALFKTLRFVSYPSLAHKNLLIAHTQDVQAGHN